MSFAVAPLGPLSEFFYLRDYWQPTLFTGWPIGLEDFLFGFFIGGIAGVIYEEIFGKKYVKRHLDTHPYWMFGVALFGLAFMVIGNIVLGFNSIYVSIAVFLIIGATMLLFRHDLLRNAFFSGLLVGALMFLFYLIFIPLFPNVIQEWWLLQNISGILLFGIPLEELAWGFGWGFFAGPAYEFVRGLKLKRT